MCTRPLLPLALTLILLLGPIGIMSGPENLVVAGSQSEDWNNPHDELTLAQLHALEDIPASAFVGGRTAGRDGDMQLGWGRVNRAGSGMTRAFGIAVDSSGNAYVTGEFHAEADFGSTTLSVEGQSEAFVAKLDLDGNWLWAKRAGGPSSDGAYAIAVDSSGNAHVTGSFSLTSVFGSTTLSSSGQLDAFVAKLDSSGNWLWANRVGGSSYDSGKGIAVDGSGNVYVTGNTNAGSTYVAKFDSTGNWLWFKLAGGGIGRGIAVDSSGNAYVTGWFVSTSADFGSTTLSSSGGSDIYVAKIDPNGNWLWAKRAGGSDVFRGLYVDVGNGIAVDSFGNAYVTGSFGGPSADFGNTTLTSSGEEELEVFVAKLDSSGTWLWAKRAGGSGDDAGLGIAIDSSGNAYVTGRFSSTSADFGSTTLIRPQPGAHLAYLSDMFVAKLDSAGNWLWAKRAGGSGNDIGDRITVDSSGKVYVTGFSYCVELCGAVFGSIIHGDSSDVGDTFAFVVRLSLDSDGDGLADIAEDCPEGAIGWTASPMSDHDGDGCRDVDEDNDDDNDGVADESDDCAAGDIGWTSGLATDRDSDGCQDSNEDEDDDNDGVADESDDCATGDLGWTSGSTTDYDSDGCQDSSSEETDADNDGVPDASDDCPTGDLGWTSGSTTDYDSDGCQDSNEDTDVDNDGVIDAVDVCSRGDLGWISSFSTDRDSDGCQDSGEDTDDDGDGVSDSADVFPQDPNETNDTDADGFGDNGDACPNNFGTSYIDRRGCIDQDGDGVSDLNDAFWMFSSVSVPISTVLLWIVIGIVVTVVGVVVVIKRRGFKSEDANGSSQNALIDNGSEHQQWTDEQGHTWRRFSDGRTEWWNGTDWQEP